MVAPAGQVEEFIVYDKQCFLVGMEERFFIQQALFFKVYLKFVINYLFIVKGKKIYYVGINVFAYICPIFTQIHIKVYMCVT